MFSRAQGHHARKRGDTDAEAASYPELPIGGFQWVDYAVVHNDFLVMNDEVCVRNAPYLRKKWNSILQHVGDAKHAGFPSGMEWHTANMQKFIDTMDAMRESAGVDALKEYYPTYFQLVYGDDANGGENVYPDEEGDAAAAPAAAPGPAARGARGSAAGAAAVAPRGGAVQQHKHKNAVHGTFKQRQQASVVEALTKLAAGGEKESGQQPHGLSAEEARIRREELRMFAVSEKRLMETEERQQMTSVLEARQAQLSYAKQVLELLPPDSKDAEDIRADMVRSYRAFDISAHVKPYTAGERERRMRSKRSTALRDKARKRRYRIKLRRWKRQAVERSVSTVPHYHKHLQAGSEFSHSTVCA